MAYREAEAPHRLYNAGDRINEVMHYSLADGHDIHCTARYNIEAPEREFFSIPKVIVIGDANIYVHFVETILRQDRYGERGVVLIDANWKPPLDPDEAENTPVARSEKEAIQKGERHWKKYILKVAQQWVDQCNAVRTSGGVPAAAGGFVVRALKLCGVADPSQAVLLAAAEHKDEMATLREQLAEQGKQIEQLLGKKPGKGKPSDSPAAP